MDLNIARFGFQVFKFTNPPTPAHLIFESEFVDLDLKPLDLDFNFFKPPGLDLDFNFFKPSDLDLNAISSKV